MNTCSRFRINAALRFHWPLQAFGASPRIWTCDTRSPAPRVSWVGSGHETSTRDTYFRQVLIFDECLFSWGANKHMVACSCVASFPGPAQLSTEKRCNGKLAGPGNEARLAVIYLSLEVLSLLTFLKPEYTCRQPVIDRSFPTLAHQRKSAWIQRIHGRVFC